MQKGPAIAIVLVVLIALGVYSWKMYQHFFPSVPPPPAGAGQTPPPGMVPPPGMTPPPAPAK